MHETSLVQSLLAQAEAIMKEHGGQSMQSIRVEIGPLSGVEPLLVKSAFDRLAASTACRGAALIVEEVPLAARCRACDDHFEVQSFRFACPSCASTSIQVLRGDEFRLLDVTISAVEQDSGGADGTSLTAEHAGALLPEYVR
jgi:hydrogenase nickel incorporation protein HypA/HybF